MPGEDLAGVYSAKDFVGWYNGLPSCREVSITIKRIFPLNQVAVALSKKMSAHIRSERLSDQSSSSCISTSCSAPLASSLSFSLMSLFFYSAESRPEL